MKFGFHYNRDNKKQTGNWGFSGDINFNNWSAASMPLDTGNGLSNLMLGNYNSYSQTNAHVYPYFRFQSWEGFAQDSWKVTYQAHPGIRPPLPAHHPDLHLHRGTARRRRKARGCPTAWI